MSPPPNQPRYVISHRLIIFNILLFIAQFSYFSSFTQIGCKFLSSSIIVFSIILCFSHHFSVRSIQISCLRKKKHYRVINKAKAELFSAWVWNKFCEWKYRKKMKQKISSELHEALKYNLSFAGCGFLGIYHGEIWIWLYDNGFQLNPTLSPSFYSWRCCVL